MKVHREVVHHEDGHDANHTEIELHDAKVNGGHAFKKAKSFGSKNAEYNQFHGDDHHDEHHHFGRDSGPSPHVVSGG
jgi:hypothetical protein